MEIAGGGILQARVREGGGIDKFDNPWHLIKTSAGSEAVCFSVWGPAQHLRLK